MNWDKDGTHWRGLIFYFDPEDPRLVVPKRTGLGRTFNFAHPAAWVITLGAPVAVATVAYLARH